MKKSKIVHGVYISLNEKTVAIIETMYDGRDYILHRDFDTVEEAEKYYNDF